MGLLDSAKKSFAIKKITKEYFDSSPDILGAMQSGGLGSLMKNQGSWDTNKKIISSKIYNFLISTDPFNTLLRSKNVDEKVIDDILENLERFGLGHPLRVNGHCPAISAFFFEDILSCLIAAHNKEDQSYMGQLIDDIHLYFIKNDLIFRPTLDPRT